MRICNICGKEVGNSLYVYRKEWDSYWHYRCYEHDKKVDIRLPLRVIKKLRDDLLIRGNLSRHEEEFLYATRSV